MGVLHFIAIMLLLCYIALIVYYRAGWIQLKENNLEKQFEPQTKISVIIPARNEEKNIALVLKNILSQFYPTHLMEIIVVDDHSTDATAAIVQHFKGVHCINLSQMVGSEKLNAYKKRAIEEGIKQAQGELIITTDADCSMKPYWLLSIAQFYEKTKAQLIASPVRITSNGQWFQTFQSLDFATMQGITGALAFHENGAMCNGANLAYTKNAFNQVQGFKGIDGIASGDDMLLMYKIEKAFPTQTYFNKCKEAIVSTTPMLTLKEFFNQRIRWASKATKFDDKRIIWVLYLVYASNFLFFVLACLGFVYHQLWFTFFGMLFAKTAIEYYFLLPVTQFFNQQKELRLFYILQFIHIPYILLSGLLGQFGSYTWKDRTVQ